MVFFPVTAPGKNSNRPPSQAANAVCTARRSRSVASVEIATGIGLVSKGLGVFGAGMSALGVGHKVEREGAKLVVVASTANIEVSPVAGSAYAGEEELEE